MSANTGALARLLEQATPGPWGVDSQPSVIEVASSEWIVCETDVSHDGYLPREMFEANAALIALAPDAVRLLTDMAAALEPLARDQAIGMNDQRGYLPVAPLLARFAALEEKAAQ